MFNSIHVYHLASQRVTRLKGKAGDAIIGPLRLESPFCVAFFSDSCINLWLIHYNIRLDLPDILGNARR